MSKELLARLAELAPDACRQSDGNYFELMSTEAVDLPWEIYCEPSCIDDLARLQCVLQGAIARRGALCRLENTEQGVWHASILQPRTGKFGFGNDNREPSLALLQAFVNWLEKVEQGAIAVGGAA